MAAEDCQRRTQKQTALVNEKRRAALNMLYIDPQNSSQIIAEQVILKTRVVGGYVKWACLMNPGH